MTEFTRRTFMMSSAVAALGASQVPADADPLTENGWRPRPATHGAAVEPGVRVPMSDGAELVADVIRPAGADGKPEAGRFPVLLIQTAYNSTVPLANMRSDYLVERGYVQVVADVRGTGNSPGTWDAFGEREQRDGYELVEWAARQPWSNGDVGTHGASYSGINQLFTAALQPPSLRAIFPKVPMGDAYRVVVGSGGQVDSGFIPLWFAAVTLLGAPPSKTLPQDPVDAVNTLLQHVGGVASFQAPQLLGALSGSDGAFDGPFYQRRSPLRVIDRVRVPTFVLGGQSDIFQRGEPLLYQRLADAGVPAKFLFGGWTHVEAVLGLGLPAQQVPRVDELELRWFDHHLRGIPDPALDGDVAPVTYFEKGSERYHRAPSWPPPDVRYRAYQLGSPPVPGDAGTLQPGDTGTGGSELVPWNPLAGATSHSTSQWTAGALPRFTDDNTANDALGPTYDLPVREGPLVLAGPMAAHLTVSTSAADGQLTVRVEDVAPDGTSRQISAGWQVLSLRALDEDETVRADGYIVRPHHPYTEDSALPVPADEPIAVDVEIFPAAARIEPGHALRVAVQTADFPHLTPPLPQLAHSVGPGIRIWHDPQRPSYVVLPERPNDK